MELTIPKPPRQTANPSPPRPAGSIRRTSSIDVSWPDGAEADRVFHGVARDLITPVGGEGSLRAAATMEAIIRPDRTIAEISADPEPTGLQELVGAKGGGHLRMLMQEVLPELIAEGHPLYLLLDDISGVSLISGWAWSLWNPDWLTAMRESMGGGDMAQMMEERADVCWGLQRGNSGMDPDRRSITEGAADGGELRNPVDLVGWHEFPPIEGVSMRRARRIDVWRDARSGRIEIDSSFQDSAPRPGGGRAALHEYRLRASADPDTLELLSLEPEGRVLPFHECPGAVGNARGLVGSSLPAIRQSVLSDLRGPKGCTHLNDALRALGDVPKLLEALG